MQDNQQIAEAKICKMIKKLLKKTKQRKTRLSQNS